MTYACLRVGQLQRWKKTYHSEPMKDLPPRVEDEAVEPLEHWKRCGVRARSVSKLSDHVGLLLAKTRAFFTLC